MEVLALLLLFCQSLLNSPAATQWAYILDGTRNQDYGYSVDIAYDKGFIFAGATASWGKGSWDVLAVKSTDNGTLTNYTPWKSETSDVVIKDITNFILMIVFHDQHY